MVGVQTMMQMCLQHEELSSVKEMQEMMNLWLPLKTRSTVVKALMASGWHSKLCLFLAFGRYSAVVGPESMRPLMRLPYAVHIFAYCYL